MSKIKRVICAMSGGVDSSVSAAILKKAGYDVVGVFMKLWSEKSDKTDLVRENICCSADAASAARAVAAKLDIPFYVINLEKEFKKAVVDYYVKEYEEGRTPNPCVICNRDIKGEVLMKKVAELEGDYLATGHYAIIDQTKKEYLLKVPKDANKDQTYFLWTLNQEKLSKTLFPVGKFTKPVVRKMAARWQLPTAERRDSQGLCFIPDRDVCGFLRRHAKKLITPGQIVDVSGNVLGIHNGLINYTIGQRERLGLGGPLAHYVVKLDSKNNQLIVGDEKDLYRGELVAGSLNWISNNIDASKVIGARIRHGHPIVDCKIEIKGKEAKVKFLQPQRAITPGQSIVFYQNSVVLGGGVIKS